MTNTNLMSTNETWGWDWIRCLPPAASSTASWIMFVWITDSDIEWDDVSFKEEPPLVDEATHDSRTSDVCAGWCRRVVCALLCGACFKKVAARGLAFVRGCKLISLTDSKSFNGCKFDAEYNCWANGAGAWWRKFAFNTVSQDTREISSNFWGLEVLAEMLSKASVELLWWNDGKLETSKRFKVDFSVGTASWSARFLEWADGTSWEIPIDCSWILCWRAPAKDIVREKIFLWAFLLQDHIYLQFWSLLATDPESKVLNSVAAMKQ